ncbi:MAG: hypothetical protein EOL95_09055 [Bacteroidia bacterium]|nr:hypothetical protein [Bacteroidia bacterium]
MNYVKILNNTILDVRFVLNQIDRNPAAEITNIKQQLKAALFTQPRYADKVDKLRSLHQVYDFSNRVISELKNEIIIEREMN